MYGLKAVGGLRLPNRRGVEVKQHNPLASGIKWAPCHSIYHCPAAVQAAPGVYVAAAHHNGGLIPGVVVASTRICQIPWGGAAIAKSDFFILDNSGNQELVWQSASMGTVPVGALQGGYSETGEKLYIGRFRCGSAYLSGKVHPSHSVCYVPSGGREVKASNYEVLCLKTIPLASFGMQ